MNRIDQIVVLLQEAGLGYVESYRVAKQIEALNSRPTPRIVTEADVEIANIRNLVESR